MEQRSHAVVIPVGELHIAAAPTLDQAPEPALSSRCARVVFDLRELAFKCALALVAGSRALERPLDVAGGHKIVQLAVAEDIT